ncbi:transmembrane protein 130 isoform X2 [Hyla sarda]|uniref:transmembrane protein 130 isoform X2 n=1 Tax=Hyla sarda TaxID=327740 RepID=UPI0024C2A217|nr:transmembrane protein 130 isoform X2 [Hyla sarda]XP_056390524.1 transmembrane protein 130 isoform X2 [Hyla sarda]
MSLQFQLLPLEGFTALVQRRKVMLSYYVTAQSCSRSSLLPHRGVMASSSLTPVIHCFLVLSAAVSSTSGYESYFLMVSSDGPITSGGQATVNASVLIANDSTSLIADPRLYHFYWIYSPLLLTHYSQNESSSAITLQCESPGSYPISAWVTKRHCSTCEPIARKTTKLRVTREIVGRLTASQADGDGAHLGDDFFLATNNDVTLSFLIHDPSNFFKSAAFTYRWTLDDRTTVLTSDPFVHHNFSLPGNLKISLHVTAHLHDGKHQRHPEKKTGDFTGGLTLQDVISRITISSPRETTTGQKVNMSLHIIGSPPLTVCWLIKSDCISLDGEECHPVVINDTTSIIRHQFTSAGRYCLSVKAKNKVSKLVGHQSITVTSTGVHPVWFVLPCCTFIAIAIGFIFYTLFRAGSHSPHQKSLVEGSLISFYKNSTTILQIVTLHPWPVSSRAGRKD